MYGFEPKADEITIQRNRALFLELKEDSAFIFQVSGTSSAAVHAHQCKQSRGETLDDHTGIYMTPAIQQVINAVLFKPKTGDGIRWPKYYKPFPIAGLALTITAVGFESYGGCTTNYTEQIECAINEWESGIRKMIVFKEQEYSPVYMRHLASLHEFNTLTSLVGLLPKLLVQVYQNGW